MKKYVRFTPVGIFVLLLGLAWGGAVSAQQTRGMGVPSNALPEELRELDVQDFFLPSDFREAGVLHAQDGHVVVVHRASGAAYFGKPGDRIYENDALITLKDSHCRIRLYSDDVVNMAPNTQFSVDAFLDSPGRGEKTSLFSLLKGKAMFYALRLFRYKDTRFKVKTPTAVVGVRGTKFGVHVFPIKGRSAAAAAGVRVAAARFQVPFHTARNEPEGLATGTVVACADGYLDVIDPDTGRILADVRPNEVFNSYTGKKTFDPANNTLNAIQADTEDGEESQAAGDQATDPGEPGGTEGAEALLAVTETVTTTTLEETGLDAEENSSAEPLFEPPGQWYFAAMLLDQGTGLIEDVYVGGADGTIVSDVPSMIDSDRFFFNEQTDTVTEVRISGVLKNAGVTWKRTTLAQNAYMSWGYWTSDMTFTGSGPYQFIEKMWWVDGDVNDRTLPKGEIAYEGGAQGTYWSPTETHDMKGSFSCRVDFDASSHEVQDFTMNVAGGGKTASIYNEQVSFDPAFKPEGYRFFMFTDGTWSLNGNTPTDKECQGIVYGGGQGIGGSCGMYNSSTKEGYAGIFHGQAR